MTGPGDLVRMAVGSLARHPVRTALTVLGVAVGTFALVASLAAGQGLDRLILGLFRGSQGLRQITVSLDFRPARSEPTQAAPTVADVSDPARRQRLQHALEREAARGGQAHPKAPLDAAGIERLARLAHVEQVTPIVSLRGRVGWADPSGSQLWPVELASADPQERYRSQLIAGEPVSDQTPGGVVVSELLLYRLGLLRDGEPASALGRELRFEYPIHHAPETPPLATLLAQGPNGFRPAELEALRRLLGRLGGLLALLALPADEQAALTKLRSSAEDRPTASEPHAGSEELRIVGVIREPTEAEVTIRRQDLFGQIGQDAGLLLAPQVAAGLWLRSVPETDRGLSNAVVTVDQMSQVGAVVEAVEALGYRTSSLIRIVEAVRLNVLLVTLTTAFIALVALTVAALGITNTMIMSVLERTHEIGVMKAVGARDGQVRMLFLIEGACVGLLGGSLGLALGWLASIPADAVARSLIAAQVRRPVTDSMFAFPPWLALGAPLAATLIATLAAYYPANRAARIDPIVALRHD